MKTLELLRIYKITVKLVMSGFRAEAGEPVKDENRQLNELP
ncbi:MAG: hypothetical protein V7K50_05710 [Nostoc sp.]